MPIQIVGILDHREGSDTISTEHIRKVDEMQGKEELLKTFREYGSTMYKTFFEGVRRIYYWKDDKQVDIFNTEDSIY